MSQSLSLSSPLPLRFSAWILERFPPLTWIAFVILYLCCSILGQAAAGAGASVVLGTREILGSIASIALFLLLRVLDEHKDYEKDMIHHPQRVLMRGLITLNHLKACGVLCFLLISAFCFYVDRGFGHTFIGFLVVFVWVCLMTKEFFVHEWLNRHLVIYAVSHMLVMPLVMLWFVMSVIPEFSLTPTLMYLGAMAFFSGFCFEFTRKTKGVEEEIVGVDTYSSLLGRGKSSFMAWLMGALELVAKILLLASLPAQGNLIPYIVIFAVLSLLMAGSFLKYLKEPTAKGRKMNEGVAALSTLVSYISVLVYVYQNFPISIG